MVSSSSNKPKSRPRMNPALVPIFLIQLIGAMGYGIMFPLLPYYGAQYGATPLVNGLLIASYALCSFVAGPILGQLSDRQGRRPWLIFSLIGTVIGFAVLGIGGSLFMLFLGRCIDGLSGGNVVIAQAYVSDVSKPEERTQNFGLMGAAFGVGFVLGPLLGLLLSPYGLAVPMWAAAALTVVATVVTYFMLPESVKPGSQMGPQRSIAGQFLAIGEVFTRPALQPLLVMFAAFVLAAFLFITSLGQVNQLQVGVPAHLASLPTLIFGALNIVFQVVLLRPAIRKLGERKLIALGLMALLIPSVGLFFVTQLWQLPLLAGFMALSMTLMRPSISALLTTLTDPRESGKVLGVSASIDALAQIAAPILGGLLIEAFTPGTPGLLGFVFAVIGLAVFFARRNTLPERAGGKPAMPHSAPAPAAAPAK